MAALRFLASLFALVAVVALVTDATPAERSLYARHSPLIPAPMITTRGLPGVAVASVSD